MSVYSKLLALSVGSLSTMVALSAPVSINFDDLGPDVIIGATYQSLGVTFLNAKTVEYRNNIPVFCAFPGSTCPTTIKSTEDFAHGFMPQPNTAIVAVFEFPVHFAALTGISINGNGYLLRAYDAVAGGNLVDSSEVFGTNDPFTDDFFATLSVNGANIRRIEFSQSLISNRDDDIQFDNLSFEAQARVPEPSTLAVALLALGMIGLSSRRRQDPGPAANSDA